MHSTFRLKLIIIQSQNFCHLQAAYRSRHSMESALNKILDDIIPDNDKGFIVALVSLDISATFDAVNHEILVQRLEDEFGITTGLCRQWIASYLTGWVSKAHVVSSASWPVEAAPVVSPKFPP